MKTIFDKRVSVDLWHGSFRNWAFGPSLISHKKFSRFFIGFGMFGVGMNFDA